MFGFYMLGLREGERTPIQQEFVVWETVLCGMPFTRLTEKNLTLRMPKEITERETNSRDHGCGQMHR